LQLIIILSLIYLKIQMKKINISQITQSINPIIINLQNFKSDREVFIYFSNNINLVISIQKFMD